MRNQRFRRALVLATAGVFLSAAAVLADSVSADADTVAAGPNTTIDLGTVAPGATIDLHVTFELHCTGTKHVNPDQTVTLTLNSMSIPPDTTASGTSSSFNPPGTAWPADGTSCAGSEPVLSANEASDISITAPTAGGLDYTYTMMWLRELDPVARGDFGTFSGSTAVTFILDVVGNTAPVLNLPSNMTVEGDTTGGAHVSFSATATDAEDNPDPTPTCTPASGALFAVGTTTVDCTVSDTDGATTTGSFDVTVVDTTAPALGSLPGRLTASTNDQGGAAVSYVVPTATDIVDPKPVVSCSPASGSTFAVGDTSVKCTATDASGNSATGTFTVSVHLNQAPTLNVPADSSVEGNAHGGAIVQFAVVAADAEDQAAPTATCAPASGSLFALGATTVSCSVTDSGHLTTSESFVVTVVDTTAPSIAKVSDINVVTNDAAGAAIDYTLPSATDIVDAKPVVTCTPASGSVAAVGNATGTCTATDANGNTSSSTFAISVRRNAAPVVVVPANMTVEGNATGGARVTFAASATDAEDRPDPTPSCSRASGSLFGLGTTTVTCTVSDSAGTTDSATFTVRVVDTTAPTMSGGTARVSVSTGSAGGAAISYTAPSADDTVDAHPDVNCSPASGSIVAVGDSLVTCTASDASGNAATLRIPVHVALQSGETWSARWDEPVGGSQMTVNGSRSIPVKVRLYHNGVEVVSGSPFLRLTSCGSGTQVADVPLVSGGRWTAKLDTSTLNAGCYRVSAMVGSSEAGFFGLEIGGTATTAKQPNTSSGRPARAPKH